MDLISNVPLNTTNDCKIYGKYFKKLTDRSALCTCDILYCALMSRFKNYRQVMLFPHDSSYAPMLPITATRSNKANKWAWNEVIMHRRTTKLLQISKIQMRKCRLHSK